MNCPVCRSRIDWDNRRCTNPKCGKRVFRQGDDCRSDTVDYYKLDKKNGFVNNFWLEHPEDHPSLPHEVKMPKELPGRPSTAPRK